MTLSGPLSRRHLLGLLVLLAAPARAHPVYDMFDLETEITLEGHVLRFDYLDQHSWLYIELADGSGDRWAFELDAAPLLRRQGVGPDHWSEGDLVAIRANPMKDGRNAGLLVGALRADGMAYGETGGMTAPGP